MYFDFDDRYQNEGGVERALNRRDGVLLSVVVHAAVIALFFLLPKLGLFKGPSPEELQLRQQQEKTEQPRFVFVQPRLDMEALKPKPRADNSDKTRTARTPEKPRAMENPLPAARGNSRDRSEALPQERARGQGPGQQPAPPAPEIPSTDIEQRQLDRLTQSQSANALPRPQQQQPPQTQAGGSLGEALRNLQKYVQKEQFDNPNGNVQDLGPLQFDTKGVEFGPWIRRFIAQVRRNWFVPYAAMSLTGHVVLQFNVHKDGRITDLTVFRPSGVDSFNTSAFNALAGSNPTEPLPPEYPDEKAFFTVTFYYNEAPPTRQQ